MKYIQIVPKTKKEEMRQILFEYLSELSQFDKSIEFDKNNKPIYNWFDCYFEEKERYPIYLKIDKVVAGMCLVREVDNRKYEIAEFYVKPEYRKNGNAFWFADIIFNLFDGDFEFSTCLTNNRAIKFWDKFFDLYKCSSTLDSVRKNWELKNKSAN